MSSVCLSVCLAVWRSGGLAMSGDVKKKKIIEHKIGKTNWGIFFLKGVSCVIDIKQLKINFVNLSWAVSHDKFCWIMCWRIQCLSSLLESFTESELSGIVEDNVYVYVSQNSDYRLIYHVRSVVFQRMCSSTFVDWCFYGSTSRATRTRIGVALYSTYKHDFIAFWNRSRESGSACCGPEMSEQFCLI